MIIAIKKHKNGKTAALTFLSAAVFIVGYFVSISSFMSMNSPLGS